MAQFVWTQKQHIGPPPRYDHAMAFDAARKQVVLFGGLGGAAPTALGDTWGWDGHLWTQLADFGPSPRGGHAMAFDTARNVAVLHGGGGLQETWEWDGADWTQVADTGPPGLNAAAMAFHPGLGKTVLFAGQVGAVTNNETWTWDGADWTQVAGPGPSARVGAAMAFSGDLQKLVLMGGAAADATGLADTWTFDGQAWTEVTDMGPGPTVASTLADAGGGPVLFGGAQAFAAAGFSPNAGTTWRFSAGKWTEIDAIGPPGRWRGACALDASRNVMVLFGGAATLAHAGDAAPATPAALGDTWEAPVAAPVAQPGQPGGGGLSVADLTLSGPALGGGVFSTIQATVSLSAAAPAPTQVAIEIFTAANQQPVDPQAVSASPLTILPGNTQGTIIITRGPAPLSDRLVLAVAVPDTNPQFAAFDA